jgi:hypothetical protein
MTAKTQRHAVAVAAVASGVTGVFAASVCTVSDSSVQRPPFFIAQPSVRILRMRLSLSLRTAYRVSCAPGYVSNPSALCKIHQMGWIGWAGLTNPTHVECIGAVNIFSRYGDEGMWVRL